MFTINNTAYRVIKKHSISRSSFLHIEKAKHVNDPDDHVKQPLFPPRVTKVCVLEDYP